MQFLLSDIEMCAALDRATLRKLRSLLREGQSMSSPVTVRALSLSTPDMTSKRILRRFIKGMAVSVGNVGGLFTGQLAHWRQRGIEPSQEEKANRGRGG